MRLDKALTLAGLTRSQARKAVSQGRALVNGAAARDISLDVDPENVTLDGRPIAAPTDVTLMLNKPAGVLTATSDRNCKTVVDLVPPEMRARELGPVGRLDKDVTGLVLLTTDGQLAHRLISPKWKAEKVYRAVCEGTLDESHVEAFARGIELSDFTAAPAGMEILSAGDTSAADVTLTEGKFHQVKRMFIAVGHPLLSLKRLRIGCVTLDEALSPGEFRRLTEAEITGLKRMSDLIQE